MALAMARDLRNEGRQLGLQEALALTRLIALKQPQLYDAAALRYLEVWCRQFRGRAAIGDGADLADALARMPDEPDEAVASVRVICARHDVAWRR
jgi:hypothetical protein